MPFWGTYDFQSYTFGHSVTSPCYIKCSVRDAFHVPHDLHVVASGARGARCCGRPPLWPALPLRGPSLSLRPFLAPPPALANGHSVTSPVFSKNVICYLRITSLSSVRYRVSDFWGWGKQICVCWRLKFLQPPHSRDSIHFTIMQADHGSAKVRQTGCGKST